jgi:hypothetical protein
MTTPATDSITASTLALDSLEIKNYRVFMDLVIPKFGRVNLIVGKNNVGKSTLLEALWLYSQKGNPTVLLDLLKSRDEYSRVSRYSEDLKERMWDIKNLFYGRAEIKDECPQISIGPIASPNATLVLDVEWFVSKTNEEGIIERQPVSDASKRSEADPFVVTRFGNKHPRFVRLDRLMDRRFGPLLSDLAQIPGHLVKANGLDSQEVAQLWDNIALTDSEDSIVLALHIIAPEVRRISFLGNKEASERRIPVARVDELPEPIPIRSMGEGMNRILGIVLAVVNSQNGILLVDEIESGLHYLAQPDIWRLIFQLAHRLNVQVFATTHSWDCINAFQMAASEDANDQGFLVRLDRRAGEIGVTSFNERTLSIATREQIEVR